MRMKKCSSSEVIWGNYALKEVNYLTTTYIKSDALQMISF